MPIQVTIDSSDADKMLAKAAVTIADLRNFWPLVIPLFIKWMGRQFDSEGDYMGSPWKKLSPDYAAWKAIMYPGKGILVATGELKRAATTPLRAATPNTLVLTIQSPKAGWQDKQGRSVIGGHLPVDAMNELQAAAVKYVNSALGGSGRSASSLSPSGGTGGSVYVSGYTTKTGKKVAGYYKQK